ncbi:MAG: hypothetical protein KME26_13715 [Oscillatoria princeps RMCB-10]|jgi:hypothetical protein|nr:hypothetical protein [Oscillatoria princeps RMCB-10]
MLSYILALAVGIGGFALYMAAFFFPEVHRKGDLIWSGVAMFYALVLWFCAGRITGAVLLGESASVALLGWLGWQTLRLRREVTPSGERTQVSQEKLSAGVSQLSGRVTGLFKGKPQQPKAGLAQTPQPKVQTPAPAPEPEKAAAPQALSEEMPPKEEAIVAATATPTEALTPEVPAAEQPAPSAAVAPAPAPTQSEPEKIPAAAALEGATAESAAPPEEETLEEEGFEPEPPQPSVQAKPPAAAVKPVRDKAKPASGAGAGIVLAPVSLALSKLQEAIQGLVSKINKPKSPPAPKTPPAKAVPETATELSDDDAFPLEMDVTFEPVPPKPASAESIHIPVGSEPRAPGKPVTDELEEPAIGEVELQVATVDAEVIVEGVATGVEPAHSATTAEPQLVRPNPPSPELLEAARKSAEDVKDAAAREPVEEIAPEAELAPPAEAPPEELPEPEAVRAPEAATPAAPVEESTPPATEPREETPPQLVRPNPPSPELVEAAREQAPAQTEAAAGGQAEEIAPEAELAPPAEAPKQEEGFAQLLRPKRTDPAVVEAEKKPAEAKSVTPPPADSEAHAAGEGNS